MKHKIYLTTILAMLGMQALKADQLPSEIIGGGTEYLTVDATTNPELVKVYKGSGYAGIEGGTILYDIPATTKMTTQNAFNIDTDFRIKNTLEIKYSGVDYNSGTSLNFNIGNGSTLILDDVYVSQGVADNAFRLRFNGVSITSKTNVYLTARNNNLAHTCLYLQYANMYLHTSMSMGMLYIDKGSTLSLGGNILISSAFYMTSGEEGASLLMNGYNLKSSGGLISHDSGRKNSKLNVTFGADADGDGKVIFAIGDASGAEILNTQLIFEDYNPDTDYILSYTALSESKMKSLLIFKGHEDAEIQVKKLTEGLDGEYINYYSYSIAIPEPSETAILFGICTFALVFYRRR